MLHASGLLSHIFSSEECDVSDLFLEMDRILRPEGWVVLCDKRTSDRKNSHSCNTKSLGSPGK